MLQSKTIVNLMASVQFYAREPTAKIHVTVCKPG